MNRGILVKEFIETFIGIDLFSFIKSCLMKESKELIFHLLTNNLTKNEERYIQQKTGKKELSSFRDTRNALQYARNICCSWIIEEAIKKEIISSGYKILNYGCDLEREILTDPKTIKNDSDIIIELKKNIFIKIEITQDYSNFVFNHKKYGFRYNKYQILQKDEAYILHLCLKKRIFFFFQINEIKEIQKEPNYIPFGGKPTDIANIEHIPYYPLKKLKDIILSKLNNNFFPFNNKISSLTKFKMRNVINRKQFKQKSFDDFFHKPIFKNKKGG